MSFWCNILSCAGRWEKESRLLHLGRVHASGGRPGKEKQWPLSSFGCSRISALTCLLLFAVEELAASPDPRRLSLATPAHLA